jgi:FAD/FMN-containing dehydrogenase
MPSALRSCQVVTADGQRLVASDTEHPELFWGLRGGGNFGIVTSFEYDLHPVGPLVVAGMVAYDLGEGPAVLGRFRDLLAQAPDELGAVANLRLAPPLAEVPAHLHGRPIVSVVVCHAGPVAIARAGIDGNPDTSPDPTWTALLTVNHPEYPSAHGCWTSALAHALGAFFGTDRVPLTVDSTVTATSRSYRRLGEVVREVRLARIAAGLHYRHSMLDGERLGRRVARHVTRQHFRARSGGRRGPARP